MEELDLDNILSGDEIATLFEEPPKKEPKEEPKEEKKEETTDFDEDNPFGTSQKESVGSEDEDIQGKGDTGNNGRVEVFVFRRRTDTIIASISLSLYIFIFTTYALFL